MKPIREDLAKRFAAAALERGGDPDASLEAIVEGVVQQHESSRGDPVVLPWTRFAHNLHLRFAQVFGAQDVTPTPTSRKKVAAFLAQRMSRRVVALTKLFEFGLYPESLTLVRAAYEDWLIASYLLLRPGEGHCDDYWAEDQLKLIAKSIRGVNVLAGAEAVATLCPPDLRARAEKYAGAKNGELKPFGGAQWAQMAESVGLKAVHDWAYTYLSGLAHGSTLNAAQMNRPGRFAPQNAGADLFVRDLAREKMPGLWAYWFSLRILTLSAKEFGVSLEGDTTDALGEIPAGARDPMSCVLVREHWGAA